MCEWHTCEFAFWFRQNGFDALVTDDEQKRQILTHRNTKNEHTHTH